MKTGSESNYSEEENEDILEIESENYKPEQIKEKVSWVLETYCRKKHFIGKVIRIDFQESEIKFLNNMNNLKFAWSNFEDCGTISLCDIIRYRNSVNNHN